MVSEISKHRALIAPWCQGCGIDIGSGGDPVVPWAISIDLPVEAALAYTTTVYDKPIHLRGDARTLPWFADQSLAWCLSSHLIEDFAALDQPQVITEWGRVVQPGGYLILLYPEQERWAQAVASGQPMNAAHQFEPAFWDVPLLMKPEGFEVIFHGWADPDLRTEYDTPDYSLLTVFRRTDD